MSIVYDAPLALVSATTHVYVRYKITTTRSVIEPSASQDAFPIPDHQLTITKANSQSAHPQAWPVALQVPPHLPLHSAYYPSQQGPA
jgi:hypothetical protein